ncbi:SRPBCC family protein [Streptomyces sp. P1-3]|uniref:SRPBCC family protein n=1 Tax=Streptomyces sp. P1-3 TaxID=3421658 RepID=UPI003D366DBE
MARFLIERRSPLPADEAWRRITDWPRHSAHVPLTRITATPPGPTRPGTVVLARTGVGRAVFDDPMEVVRWEPPEPTGRPGHCRLEKRGSVVVGWAEIHVRRDGAGSRVVWEEDARVRALPRLCDRPTAWVGRLVFGRMIGRMLGPGRPTRTTGPLPPAD